MRRHAKNNFVYLLFGLLFLFALIPLLHQFSGERLEFDLLRGLLLVAFSLFIVISVWSLYREGLIFRVGLVLAGLNIAISIAGLIVHSEIIDICAILLVMAFSMLSCFIAGRHVFSWHETDTNSLTGAVCVYLLLGLIWALFYHGLSIVWPTGLFQGLLVRDRGYYLDDFLYFSFVTLTTAGYGDITPINPMVKTMVYLEIIVGQFYMAILVSGLVAHFMGQRLSR